VTLVRSIVLILGVSVALHALLSRALRVGLIVVIAACMVGNVPAGSDFYTRSYEGPRGFVGELLRRDILAKRRNMWFMSSVMLAFGIFVIVSANGWETHKTVATLAAVAAIFLYSIWTAALSDPSRDATSVPRFGKDSRHLP